MATLTTTLKQLYQSVTLKTTPPGRYVMPVESSRHSHTLMGFPSIDSVDNEDDLIASQTEVTRIANTIARYEPVHLYARKSLMDKAKSMSGPNVFVKEATVDQLWVRDSGPVYVYDTANSVRTVTNFNFNYWGAKLPFTGDEKVARQIAKQSDTPVVKSRLTVEGGGIEHDGEGTFLGTESCIINNNRNPNFNKAAVEAELREKLGVTHFIWIPGLTDFDITDFHIDALARFIRPGVVLLSKPDAGAPEVIRKVYNEARSILSKSKDAQGRSLTIHEVEEVDPTLLGPPDVHNEVVASYANYYLVNGAVIIPKFGQELQDRKALEFFTEMFPEREVAQVEINMLPRTGGGIHCATQQVPDV